MRMSLVVCAGLAVAAGCATRVTAVDAVSGAPIAASARSLGDGRIVVEANGYEPWTGPADGRPALRPLWQAAFAGERVEAKRPSPPPAICCPGARAR
jgi:hypothetical protein